VVDAPVIAAVRTDTEGTSIGHATTAKAQPAEPCYVPDSTRVFWNIRSGRERNLLSYNSAQEGTDVC